MTSPQNRSLSPQGGFSPFPDGLRLPEVIITRRTRTQSMNGRIEDEIREGTVKFFCRSRGHGFIDDDQVSLVDFPSFPSNIANSFDYLLNVIVDWRILGVFPFTFHMSSRYNHNSM